MRRHLMVSERIFSCTCTDIWCYINRPSLVLAQTLAYLHRHLMLRYRVLGYRGGGPYHRWGVPGRRPGPHIRIYIYYIIYIYIIVIYKFICSIYNKTYDAHILGVYSDRYKHTCSAYVLGPGGFWVICSHQTWQ